MGNSYCSSCECVKGDKQNEFDDSKLQPLPVASSQEFAKFSLKSQSQSKTNTPYFSSQKKSDAAAIQDNEYGAVDSQWQSSFKSSKKHSELSNIEYKKQISLQKRSQDYYTPKRDSFVSGAGSFKAAASSTESKSNKHYTNSIQSTLRAVIKIQSRYRGYLTRKAYEIRSNELIKRKYFTKPEFQETIQKKRIYKADAQLEYKEYTYKCSGAIYKGFWKGGFREGKGAIVWPDGASYDGNWKDNKAEGFGKFIHANGDIYEGYWSKNQACGLGTYISKISGGTYRGEWKNDLQHGKGIETWNDCSTYEGEFFLGEKCGYGKQLWPDGSIFIGMWANNMISGVGRQQWVDNRVYEGEFKNNLMHGFGKFIFSDGKTYEGFYQNDKKNGFGIFCWLNNKKYEGWWTDGKQDGYGILRDGHKKLFGIWKDGQKVQTLTQLEAKQILKDYDEAMQIYELQKDEPDSMKVKDFADLDKIQRMTFYSPDLFLIKQKEIEKQLMVIDDKFKVERMSERQSIAQQMQQSKQYQQQQSL